MPLPPVSDHWRGPNAGQIVVAVPLSVPPEMVGMASSVRATFSGSSAAGLPGPSTQSEGACTLSLWHPSLIQPADAGTVQVGDVTLTESSVGSYGIDLPSAPWQPGDAIHLTSTGAAFPTFDAAVVMPHGLTVVTPAAPSGGVALDVATTAGLTFQWAGGAPCDLVQLTLAAPPAGDEAVEIHCLFHAADSAGSVPADLLSELGPHATLSFGTVAVVAMDLGADHLDVYAENEAFVADVVLHP